MIRIFGDAIDDKIFPKKIKRFTQEEKDLIEKFVNSILRNDKKSELEKSEITQFNDSNDPQDVLEAVRIYNDELIVYLREQREEKHKEQYVNVTYDPKINERHGQLVQNEFKKRDMFTSLDNDTSKVLKYEF